MQSQVGMRQLLPLVLAAMAVVTLGFISVARHNGASELLMKKGVVGSTPVKQGDHQTHTRGYGNEASPSPGPGSHFFNTKDQKKQKLLVGSFPIGPGNKQTVQPRGIGNQAAPQGHMGDIGTNTVFHGVKADGGIAGARKFKKQMKKKSLVGSFKPGPGDHDHPVQPPHGFGNQASPSMAPSSHFYNNKAQPSALHMKIRNWLPWAKSKTFDLHKEGVVGSFVPQGHEAKPHGQTVGTGNQASPAPAPGSHFFNAKDQKKQKLLVNSYVPDGQIAKPRVQTVGTGNQAAPAPAPGTHFFNAKDQTKQKLLVGSFGVNPASPMTHQPHGIGNQAAPQGHMGDIGTNTVFHGVKADGGIAGARRTKKQMHKKGVVGSFRVGPSNTAPKQPHGYGNEASPSMSPSFYTKQ